jgi:hypothetical protein
VAFGIVSVPIPVLVAVMFASVALAIYGTLFRIGWSRIGFFLLQQVLLGIMGWGGVYAALQGHYLDGTPIPAPQIFNDQIAYSAWFLAHIWAMGFRARHA